MDQYGSRWKGARCARGGFRVIGRFDRFADGGRLGAEHQHEASRKSALQRVGRRVMWRDPTNGATTLQSAGVPAEIIQALPPPRGEDR